MQCIACNHQMAEWSKGKNYIIFRCNNCGLGATQGLPVHSYNQYERDADYISEYEQFKNIFVKRVKILNKYIKRGLVLEIGSSTGTLLSLLKEKQFDIQGIEPSKQAFVRAVERGIPTINSNFEQAKLTRNSYDGVVMNHVLEHLENPSKVLEKIRDVLKGGGVLMIDVPNFSSLSADIKGGSWQYLLPGEHLWHFTPKSLEKLLEKHNFTVIYEETTSGVWGYDNPLLEISQSLFAMKKRFFSNVLTFIPSYFISKLGFGTNIIIVAVVNK